ncbi:hypothetical protein LEMLEM_LOCUS1352, partial [Lemmus lemmus]
MHLETDVHFSPVLLGLLKECPLFNRRHTLLWFKRPHFM